MVFTGFRVVAEVFRAKIRTQHAVWVQSAEVNALSRVKLGLNMREMISTWLGQTRPDRIFMTSHSTSKGHTTSGYKG